MIDSAGNTTHVRVQVSAENALNSCDIILPSKGMYEDELYIRSHAKRLGYHAIVTLTDLRDNNAFTFKL